MHLSPYKFNRRLCWDRKKQQKRRLNPLKQVKKGEPYYVESKLANRKPNTLLD